MSAHEKGIEAAVARAQFYQISAPTMEEVISAYLEESGQVLVPKEPTRAMWAAMANTLYGYANRHHDKVARDLYKAMLAAALASEDSEG